MKYFIYTTYQVSSCCDSYSWPIRGLGTDFCLLRKRFVAREQISGFNLKPEFRNQKSQIAISELNLKSTNKKSEIKNLISEMPLVIKTITVYLILRCLTLFPSSPLRGWVEWTPLLSVETFTLPAPLYKWKLSRLSPFDMQILTWQLVHINLCFPTYEINTTTALFSPWYCCKSYLETVAHLLSSSPRMRRDWAT